MKIWEVGFMNATGTTTMLVQGTPDKVKEWADKEAEAYGWTVTHIDKSSMPNTRAEREQVVILQ
jgi:hypothetical protein